MNFLKKEKREILKKISSQKFLIRIYQKYPYNGSQMQTHEVKYYWWNSNIHFLKFKFPSETHKHKKKKQLKWLKSIITKIFGNKSGGHSCLF